jgi:hypothetical protein
LLRPGPAPVTLTPGQPWILSFRCSNSASVITPAVVQIGEFRELECGAGAACAKGRIPGQDLAFAPVLDDGAVHAHVDHDADQRQQHDQQDPAGLGPAAEVPVAQDIHDDPHHQEEPEQPEEEPQHGQEYVKQRIRHL